MGRLYIPTRPSDMALTRKTASFNVSPSDSPFLPRAHCTRVVIKVERRYELADLDYTLRLTSSPDPDPVIRTWTEFSGLSRKVYALSPAVSIPLTSN